MAELWRLIANGTRFLSRSMSLVAPGLNCCSARAVLFWFCTTEDAGS